MSRGVRLLALLLLAGAVAAGLRSRRRSQRATAGGWPGLALALDVWALCSQAGAPAARAVAEAAVVGSGQTRDRLTAVAAALTRGEPAATAWSDPDGGLPPALRNAADAAVRTERDGLALAPVLRQLAAAEREVLASRGLVAARRATVWAVLPLGLCYLPAYVLLGVVPAVVGLVHLGT